LPLLNARCPSVPSPIIRTSNLTHSRRQQLYSDPSYFLPETWELQANTSAQAQTILECEATAREALIALNPAAPETAPVLRRSTWIPTLLVLLLFLERATQTRKTRKTTLPSTFLPHPPNLRALHRHPHLLQTYFRTNGRTVFRIAFLLHGRPYLLTPTLTVVRDSS